MLKLIVKRQETKNMIQTRRGRDKNGMGERSQHSHFGNVVLVIQSRQKARKKADAGDGKNR